jgi:predicted glycosyltransferase
MRRNLLIAQTLSGPPVDASILLIAGASEANIFPRPHGVDCLTLPALAKEAAGYESRSLEVSLHELIRLRAQTIRAAMKTYEPDVLIVDKVPRGIIGELNPTLQYLRGRGRTTCVLGLRDVLDEPESVRREWAALRSDQAIREYYDSIWVYGDPTVYDLGQEYRLAADVAKKIRYTGYLDRSEPDRVSPEAGAPNNGNTVPDGPYVLCTVGGGQDGAQLAECFARAELPAGRSGVVLAGPFMPEAVRNSLHRVAADDPRLEILDLTTDPTDLVVGAERVVAMGGYNTVSELVSLEKRALVIPRVTPRREQLIRAERFAALGLIEMCHPDALTPRALTDWMARDLPAPRHGALDLGGRGRVRDFLLEMLGRDEAKTLVAT